MIRYIRTVMLSIVTLSALEVQALPVLDEAYEINDAHTLLNDTREAAGLNRLVHNPSLQQAAQAHANYIVRHREPSHDEHPAQAGFSGETPHARAIAAGYASQTVRENLSTNNKSAKDSIDGLFSAIYHRFAFLDPTLDEVGVGMAQEEQNGKVYNNAFVYLMGNSALDALCRKPSYKGYGAIVYGFCADEKKRAAKHTYMKAKHTSAWLNPKIILYPYDKQEDVYPAFYSEIPDPLPDAEVSGFPVSVMFNPYFFQENVTLESFYLFDSSGKEVPSLLMDKQSDPNGKFDALQFALFPLQRLEYDERYRAVVAYRYKEKLHRLSWTFHTRIPPELWFRIESKEARIDMQGERSAWLYMVPQDEHDIVGEISYDKALEVRFIDANTLRIVLPEDADKSYTLQAGERRVRIVP